MCIFRLLLVPRISRTFFWAGRFRLQLCLQCPVHLSVLFRSLFRSLAFSPMLVRCSSAVGCVVRMVALPPDNMSCTVDRGTAYSRVHHMGIHDSVLLVPLSVLLCLT